MPNDKTVTTPYTLPTTFQNELIEKGLLEMGITPWRISKETMKEIEAIKHSIVR